MERYLPVILVLSAICTNLFAAEAGMPQLDPKYWASQAFWLILIFTILYISIAKFYLPKIKNNLDDRENKIKDEKKMVLFCALGLRSALATKSLIDMGFEILDELQRKDGKTIIMVEQNAKQALSISDRGYVLVTGENKFEGSGKELSLIHI